MEKIRSKTTWIYNLMLVDYVCEQLVTMQRIVEQKLTMTWFMQVKLESFKSH